MSAGVKAESVRRDRVCFPHLISETLVSISVVMGFSPLKLLIK